MISANIDRYRFVDGPSFHYNGTPVTELVEIIKDTEGQVEYLNMLKGVDTNTAEVRQVAAAGVVRAYLEQGSIDKIGASLELLLATIEEEATIFPELPDADEQKRTAVTGMLDSASVIATRLNRPASTIDALADVIDVTEPTLILAIAHGGVISAARTFMELGGDESVFRAFKFSRLKSKDHEPNFHPYPDNKKSELVSLAEDRQVVIHDEDCSTRKTLDAATEYFAKLFDKPVVGVAPVIHERRITFNPQVVKVEPVTAAA